MSLTCTGAQDNCNPYGGRVSCHREPWSFIPELIIFIYIMPVGHVRTVIAGGNKFPTAGCPGCTADSGAGSASNSPTADSSFFRKWSCFAHLMKLKLGLSNWHHLRLDPSATMHLVKDIQRRSTWRRYLSYLRIPLSHHDRRWTMLYNDLGLDLYTFIYHLTILNTWQLADSEVICPPTCPTKIYQVPGQSLH